MGRGRGARYDDRHLVRSVVARQLRSTGAPLPAIAKRIASMTDVDGRHDQGPARAPRADDIDIYRYYGGPTEAR